jgi:hypothetical protein
MPQIAFNAENLDNARYASATFGGEVVETSNAVSQDCNCRTGKRKRID